MGLTRDFCFFIVVEQIILGNIQLVRSISSFATNGYSNPILWAQMPTGFIQILVAVILVQGLLERKSGKFLPWIIVNALGCLVLTVATIVTLFDTSMITQMFEIGGSRSVIYIVMLMVSVFQWVIWITVLLYYRHLKLKEIKRKEETEVKEENVETPAEQAVFQHSKNPAELAVFQHSKMTDQSPLRNVQYVQPEMEEHLPINRLYPAPTAPDL